MHTLVYGVNSRVNKIDFQVSSFRLLQTVLERREIEEDDMHDVMMVQVDITASLHSIEEDDMDDVMMVQVDITASLHSI